MESSGPEGSRGHRHFGPSCTRGPPGGDPWQRFGTGGETRSGTTRPGPDREPGGDVGLLLLTHPPPWGPFRSDQGETPLHPLKRTI